TAIGSFGYFSASSINWSASLFRSRYTRPMNLSRSSSVRAPPPDASWYSLRSPLYCSAGVAPPRSGPSSPADATQIPSATMTIPPAMRRMKAPPRSSTAGANPHEGLSFPSQIGQVKTESPAVLQPRDDGFEEFAGAAGQGIDPLGRRRARHERREDVLVGQRHFRSVE